MTDIALIFDNATGEFDFAMDGPDLQVDDSFETAIFVSLCSDARAGKSDVLPDGSDDRRGWWGDFAARVPGDTIGSKRWLLSRAKITDENIRLLAEYDKAALAWMVADGVAAAVDVTTSRAGTYEVAETITITRPDGTQPQYAYTWSFLDGR